MIDETLSTVAVLQKLAYGDRVNDAARAVALAALLRDDREQEALARREERRAESEARRVEHEVEAESKASALAVWIARYAGEHAGTEVAVKDALHDACRDLGRRVSATGFTESLAAFGSATVRKLGNRNVASFPEPGSDA